MSLKFLNRCIWRATSSGAGSFVVASAISGYEVPETCLNPVVVNAATYRYFSESDDKTQWEIGYGVYTTANDTLTRATILDSSNAGSVVTFSAAPKVHMGGPLAQDMQWEVIGDTTISSPVASVTHTLDPSLYAQIKTMFFGWQNEVSPNNVQTYAGVQFQQSGGTVDWDLKSIVEMDIAGAAVYTTGEFKFTYFVDATNGHGVRESYAVVGSSIAQGQDAYGGLNLTATTKLVYDFQDDNSNPLNSTAGRIITYGLRLP